jgi:lipoyl(octanoyl) transferase
MTPAPSAVVRHLGLVEYVPTWRQMQQFTDARTPGTSDEIWSLQHPSVFTLGMNASRDHLLAPGNIPIVEIDRGGQVTYHGPGQLVVYPLLDLDRLGLNVRRLVTALEQSVIDLAASWGIEAYGRRDAPGVYVDDRKLASLGLRIRKGCCYHGLALNVNMELEPFGRINPCGYRGLQVTQLAELGVHVSVEETADRLITLMLRALGITSLP